MKPNWLELVTAEHPASTGMANLYGVVLYTDKDVAVAKVLADELRWKALNEISGTRWIVFAARGERGERNKGYMHAIWKEPGANKELLEMFGLSSTEKLPLLMIYAEDSDRNWRRRAVKIKGETEEEAYQSLAKNLRLVESALSGFIDENLRFKTTAFDVVNEHRDSDEAWELLKKIPQIYKLVTGILKSVLT